MSWRGQQIGGMTREEMNEFLKGPWTARLATLKPDGWPYVVPCWYHWDGVAFWVVPRERSVWAHNMALDPRVSLVVDEPDPPIRKVICEGIAVVVEAASARTWRTARSRSGTRSARSTPARATWASGRPSTAAGSTSSPAGPSRSSPAG